MAALAPVDAASVADYLGRYERRLTLAHEGDELLLDTVYGTLQFRSLPGLDGLFVCTTHFLFGALVQLLTDETGRVTLSLGFGLENGALVNPLVVARLGDAAPPRHPGHHGRHRASPGPRAFDWRQLSKIRRWNHAQHHPNGDRRVSGPGLQ